MTKKIIIGGVLAALAMFIWNSIAHMLLPIGELGVKSITNEDAVIAAMKANITEDGFYFIPGEGMAEEIRSRTAWHTGLSRGGRKTVYAAAVSR